MKFFAQSILAVHFSSRLVFVRCLKLIEGPAMLEKLGNLGSVLRQLQDKLLGTMGLDFRAFNGIVVNKYEAVQAEVQVPARWT